MRIAFAVVLTVHALIHAMGFLKAFDLLRAPQLTIPISRPMGLLWLAAGILLVASSMALFLAPRSFWLLALVGVVASQIAIAASWGDARFGTIANVLTLLAVVYGAFAWGPFGLHAEYEKSVSRHVAQIAQRAESAPAGPVTDADLARLPALVQRYLRYVGVVGQPHVRGFRARFTGRIRSGPDAQWMPFSGEQHNFIYSPTRLFSMNATMRGLPVYAFHAYDNGAARMRVKVLSLFGVVDAAGENFTRTETVTLFNDMCIMAPGALVDALIRWKELDAKSVEGTFTNGPHTIRAVLLFNDEGALVNFWSDDRPALAPDGVTFVPQRWSTPVGTYRHQGPVRLATTGEGRYAAAAGDYAYIQFDALDVSYDLGSR